MSTIISLIDRDPGGLHETVLVFEVEAPGGVITVSTIERRFYSRPDKRHKLRLSSVWQRKGYGFKAPPAGVMRVSKPRLTKAIKGRVLEALVKRVEFV